MVSKKRNTTTGTETKTVSFDPPEAPRTPPTATSEVKVADAVDQGDLVILSAISTSNTDAEPPKEGSSTDSASESPKEGGSDDNQDQTINAPVPGTQGNWVNVNSQTQAP